MQGSKSAGAAPAEASNAFGGVEISSASSTPGGGFGSAGPSAPPPPAAAPRQSSSFDSGSAADVAPRAEMEAAPEPADRPGLGTEWGETRRSSITTVPFVRADASNPIASAALFYNDEQGARAMANVAGFRRTPAGSFTTGSSLVSIGLRDERGSFFTGFVAGERNFIVGEAGMRYSIVIRNRTQNRLECVVSVDGLDVLDGKPASFAKRGYLVDPRSELEIDGFRQSMDTVAAFRFGSVRGSYANQKHGDTRNVGVIGVAIFHERGTNPSPDEVQRRLDANPFPGQFATPPN